MLFKNFKNINPKYIITKRFHETRKIYLNKIYLQLRYNSGTCDTFHMQETLNIEDIQIIKTLSPIFF
jgi:hypothetical protein